MNELALPLEAPELLSARQVAMLLKLSVRAVEKRMVKVSATLRAGIRAWPLEAFPVDYQEQLRFTKKKAGAWLFADLLQIATPRWVPDFKFATLPAFSQLKAQKVKEVMLVYFAVLYQDDATEHMANCAARQKWLEVFAEGCNEKTIRRWAAKIEERGTIEWAPLEAYADRKACPHINQRSENRSKKRVPAELIAVFKGLCVQPAMTMAAAFRVLESDWQLGKSVPGIGAMTAPRQPFPFRLSQLRKFAPSSGARQIGNEGKAAALRDSLPHMTRTYSQLRPAELYLLDDTRINVAAIDDVTGKPVELHCYICMEAASRAIVGYVIREGHMRASDVDALIAQVLRTCGMAHPKSGYRTTILFERGAVACTKAREDFITGLLPDLIIKRTSMDGGQNMPGDYVQASSGHWMGKGAIESFMRTLGYFLFHLPGQRGSTWATMPSMVGSPTDPHKGGQVHEAAMLAAAAMEKAFIESNGENETPNAAEAIKQAGVNLPLKRVAEFRQAFALAIENYNSCQDHRREGFRQLPVDRENGGVDYRPESSNERWAYLVHREEQRGTAPQRICPAEAALLLHKAKPVLVTKQGVNITIDKIKYRFWHPDSIACQEASLLTGTKKEYLCLHHPDDLSEIYLLQNSPGTWEPGEPVRFLECLPQYDKAAVNDQEELGEAREATRRVFNRAAGEYAAANAQRMKKVTFNRKEDASKFVGVVPTRNGDRREVRTIGELSKQIALEKARLRHAQAQAAAVPVIEDYETPDYGAVSVTSTPQS